MFESTQAKILAILFAIEILVAAIMIGVRAKLGALIAIPIYLLIVIPLTLLSVFDQDCVVVGGCNIWAWVRFAFFAIGAVAATIAMIVVAVKGKKDNKAVEKEKK